MLMPSHRIILVSKHPSIDFHVFQSMLGPKGGQGWVGRKKKRLILSFRKKMKENERSAFGYVSH